MEDLAGATTDGVEADIETFKSTHRLGHESVARLAVRGIAGEAQAIDAGVVQLGLSRPNSVGVLVDDRDRRSGASQRRGYG
jgi:hypothetical protein